MIKYNVVINEEQRDVLLEALDYMAEARDGLFGEAQLLKGMIEALPESEKDDPGLIHDFTL
jgi:hypothetical protein